jgi:ribosomal protein L37AE/L43A
MTADQLLAYANAHPFLAGLGGGCVFLLLAALTQTIRLSRARAALADAERRLTPAPTRAVESRREAYGLLWFPTLTVKDGERLIVAGAAGLPNCARCVQPLSLMKGASEEWACSGCSERRAGTAADLSVSDQVVAETIAEFVIRNKGYRPANGLPSLKRAAA